MTHDEGHRLLAAGAALDDLEPLEQAEQASILAACPDCTSLTAELDDVLVDLALEAPERRPPADLLAGIRAAIASAEPSRSATDRRAPAVPRGRAPAVPAVTIPSPVPVSSVIPFRSATRRPLFAAIGLAAAVAIVAVGLGARTASLGTELEGSRAEVAALRHAVADQGAAMAVAMNPRHRTATLAAQPIAPATVATLVYVPGSTEAWLIADHLPATPAGSTYQVWYADGSGVHPLGTEAYGGAGAFIAGLGVDLAGASAVMVTLEPAGGATGAPGPEVVFGTL